MCFVGGQLVDLGVFCVFSGSFGKFGFPAGLDFSWGWYNMGFPGFWFLFGYTWVLLVVFRWV